MSKRAAADTVGSRRIRKKSPAAVLSGTFTPRKQRTSARTPETRRDRNAMPVHRGSAITAAPLFDIARTGRPPSQWNAALNPVRTIDGSIWRIIQRIAQKSLLGGEFRGEFLRNKGVFSSIQPTCVGFDPFIAARKLLSEAVTWAIIFRKSKTRETGS